MYTIIPLTPSHLDQVEQIETACFADPWSRGLLADALSAENALALGAADEAGVLTGYVLGSYVLDEGYVDNVAVRPDVRRQGIASLLLAALREHALACRLTFLTLEVRASNLPALMLYTEQGYVPVGRRKNYYAHPREDAILMTLEL